MLVAVRITDLRCLRMTPRNRLPGLRWPHVNGAVQGVGHNPDLSSCTTSEKYRP